MSMTHLERFRALMNNQSIDRLPKVEWAMWWDKTVERWLSEGLELAADGPDAVTRTLGLDVYHQFWLRPRAETLKAESHGAPLCSDEAGYESILPVLFPEENPAPLGVWGKAQEEGECLFWMTLEGFFWFPRTLFGIENHLFAFYDFPELMHRMNQDLLEFHLEFIRKLAPIAKPAFVTLAEDMSYNHGPMLSEDLFNEFCAPYYRQLTAAIKEELCATVIVDTDGDLTEMIPWLQGAGVDGALPLERQAGVDGMAIRQAHPDFALIGHYDKMVMPHGEAAIREEFQRLLPLMQAGRFIPSVDHQTPPGVSLENYRIYLELLDEYVRVAAGV